MPDDSAPTPSPDPELVITPADADRLQTSATAPCTRPSTTRKPRKPRPRRPAATESAPAATSPAEAVPERDPAEGAAAVTIIPPDAAEIAEVNEPEVVDTAEPVAAPDSVTSEIGASAEWACAPAAVDPAPHHAPPRVTSVAHSALPVVTPTAGLVSLSQALARNEVRRVIVTGSYLFCLVGAVTAFGVVDSGKPRLSAVLSPTLSLLAVATLADGLWWVVLVALAVYVGWLWLPGNAADPRGRAMGYPSAVTLVILGLWFSLIRTGDLTGGAFVSLLVVGALMVTLRAADRVPSRSFMDRQCSQLGFAAALGWMSVLSTSAIAGALVTHEVPAYFVSAETWGILATTALLGVGMALVRYFPGRLYIAGALSWGFVCIAYARVLGQPRSYFIGVVALVSALLILIAGVAVFLWARSRARERVG